MNDRERWHELAGRIYAAILAGAGSRGGTYGEEDLRRYARYAMRAAEIYHEEFFRESSKDVEENRAWANQIGRMGGGL